MPFGQAPGNEERMSEETHEAAMEPCQPDDGCGGTTCRLCGEPLPLPDAAARADGGASPSPAGVPFALVECPGCGAQQVRALGAPLCDGESLALRHALAYLARRNRRPSLPGREKGEPA